MKTQTNKTYIVWEIFIEIKGKVDEIDECGRNRQEVEKIKRWDKKSVREIDRYEKIDIKI